MLLVELMEKFIDKFEISQQVNYYSMLSYWMRKSLTKATGKFCVFILKNSIRNTRRNLYNKLTHVSPMLLCNKLTHVSPMLHFYNSLKSQKIFGFLMFSGGLEMEHKTKMG